MKQRKMSRHISILMASIMVITTLGCTAGSIGSQTLTPEALATQTQPLPTSTATPSITPTPTSTPTPTPLPAYGGLAPQGTLARLGRGTLSTFVLSPDASILAAGSALGVYLYSIDTFEDIAAYPTEAPVEALAWSSDGAVLAVGVENKIILMNPLTGEILNMLEGPESEEGASILDEEKVRTLAWSPDSNILASGFSGGAVIVWDATSGETLNEIVGNPSSVGTILWSPDGDTIAYRTSDVVMLRDPLTGERILTFEEHTKSVSAIAWSPDGTRFASCSNIENTILIWDAVTGERQRTMYISTKGGQFKGVGSLSWSVDGITLLAAELDGDITLWNTDTGGRQTNLQAYTSSVGDAAWLPDGMRVIARASNEIGIWNVENGELLASLDDHTSTILDLAWSPDGLAIAAAMGHAEVILWDVRAGEPIRTITETNLGIFGTVDNIDWSPDGSTLAYGGWHSYQKGYVSLREPETGDEVRRIRDSGMVIEPYVTWSPDGSVLATALGNDVALWDPVTGAKLETLSAHTNNVYGLAYSPDGQFLASASYDRSVIIWDVATLEILHVLEGHTECVNSVAWSPDGSQVVSASNDKTVIIWDPAAGAELHRLEGHTNEVNQVAWSPDGTQIATAGDDNLVMIWDANTGELLTSLEGHNHRVQSVAWSPDGAILASGSTDGTIILWQISE